MRSAGVTDTPDGGWTVTDTKGQTFKVKNVRRRPALAIMVATYPSHAEHMFVGQKVSAVEGGRKADMIGKNISMEELKKLVAHHEKMFGATDVEIYLLE
jgi:hypothetical protein